MPSGALQPLRGLAIVTLAFNVPGPVAARRLAHLGAAVTRVEPPDGDPFAAWCPGWYASLCEGQARQRLDLKTPQGRAAMDGLLAASDLFLTSIRPGALARLALDQETLKARHPRLCQVAILGHPAPDRERVGHDLTYLAGHGLLSPPRLPNTLLADLAGAEAAVSTALALLLARERGQGAGYAEVALTDCAEPFAAPWHHGLTRPDGLLGGGSPRYNLYPTRQGWIAVAALEDRLWTRLLQTLGLPGQDPTTEDLARHFLSRTADAWEHLARTLDLPLAAIREPADPSP